LKAASQLLLRQNRRDPRVDRLLAWFAQHRRPLPWRRAPTPYRIWVAEVLLQQTRVAQALPYYERFVRAFPTVRALARATEGDVLKAWEGAGYYARARNLHRAARTIVQQYGGELPRSPSELEALPGIGPYIAAAVASLAFGERVPALEANGLRVVARWTLEMGDIRRPAVRRRLADWLVARWPPGRAGAVNEALMELGETVCLPRRPRCPECPVAAVCAARQSLPDPSVLPRRARARTRPHVEAAVVAVRHRGRWLLLRRPSEGLLGGLWEFPGGKIEPGEAPSAAASRELREETGLVARDLQPVGTIRHEYSHFAVTLHIFEAAVADPAWPHTGGRAKRWVAPGKLSELALPRATLKAVQALTHRTEAGTASPDSGSRRGRTAS
jgi:A/G-specific adenine glycosylase